MDQIKIGKFIAQRRKNANLTQMQLAEKLGITDRAISKWETGRSLPDSSIMLALCDILGITVNDLLSGEVVAVEQYSKELENKLLEMVKKKEESDKRLLRMEIVMGIVSILPLFAATAVVLIVPMREWLGAGVVFASMIPLLTACFFMIRIEQVAGYYACELCGHRHVPTYGRMLCSAHINRTRYLRCPKCGKASWQKKVLNKE